MAIGTKGSTPGIDSVISETLAVVPTELARKIHLPWVKCSLAIAEPLQWKGGTAEICKGRGDPRICKHFRSILISDHLDKNLRRANKIS